MVQLYRNGNFTKAFFENYGRQTVVVSSGNIKDKAKNKYLMYRGKLTRYGAVQIAKVHIKKEKEKKRVPIKTVVRKVMVAASIRVSLFYKDDAKADRSFPETWHIKLSVTPKTSVPLKQVVHNEVVDYYGFALDSVDGYYWQVLGSSGDFRLDSIDFTVLNTKPSSNMKGATLEDVPMKTANVLMRASFRFDVSKQSLDDMDNQCVYKLLSRVLVNRKTGKPFPEDKLFDIFNEAYEAIYDVSDLDAGVGNSERTTTSIFELTDGAFTKRSGVTVRMVKHLAKTLRISMTCMDQSNRLITQYIVPKKGSNTNLQPLIFYYSDEHMFLVEDKTQRRRAAATYRDASTKRYWTLHSKREPTESKTVRYIPYSQMDAHHAGKNEIVIAITDTINLNDIFKQYVAEKKTVPAIKKMLTETQIKSMHVNNASSMQIVASSSKAYNIKWTTMQKCCELLGINFHNQGIGSFMHDCWVHFSGDRITLVGKQRQAFLEKHNFTCALCKRKFANESLHIDHVQAIGNRGSNNYNNLQVLCKICHINKNKLEKEAGYHYGHSLVSRFSNIGKKVVSSDAFKRYAFIEKCDRRGVSTTKQRRNISKVDKSQLHYIDGCKCRRNLMMYSEYGFPVYSCLDNVEVFDPTNWVESAEPPIGNFYVVSNNHLPLRGNGWYSTPLVKYCLTKKIIQLHDIKYQYVASHSVRPSKFKSFFNLMLRTLGQEAPHLAKLAINSFAGFLGKTEGTAHRSRFTSSCAEAMVYMHQNMGQHYTATKINDACDIYNVISSTKYEKEEHCYPVYAQVLDLEAIQLHEMITIIESVKGNVVHHVNTDGVLFSSDKGSPKLDISKYQHADHVPKFQYETVKSKHLVMTERMATYQRLDNFILPLLPFSIGVDNTDDFTHWVDWIVKSNEGEFIEGSPGTGKSHLTRMIIERLQQEKKSMYILAPTHVAKNNLHSDAITLAMFRRLTHRHLDKVAKSTDYIIVDEVSMMGEVFYSYFIQMKRFNPKLKFILVGDYHQLSPVADSKEGAQYNYSMSQVLRELVDYNTIKMTKCRRSSNKLFELCQQVKSSNDVTTKTHPHMVKRRQVQYVNLCHSNRKRLEVNDICMEHWIRRKRSKNVLRVPRAKALEHTQDMHLAVSMPMIGRRNDLKLGIINNGLYKIVKIIKKDIYIKLDGDSQVIHVPFNRIQEVLAVGFCMTVHCAQGRTINGTYMIHEWDNLSRRLRYVALSRGRDIHNVVFA